MEQDNIQADVTDISTKRIKTAFIYAVFALEEEIGHMWGENKDDATPLTPQEQEMFDKFMKWRKIVMDYGHMQMRLCSKEINKRYKLKKDME